MTIASISVPGLHLLGRLIESKHKPQPHGRQLFIQGDHAFWARKVGPNGATVSNNRDPVEKEDQRILRSVVETLGAEGYVHTPALCDGRIVRISREGEEAYHRFRNRT